MSQHSGDNATQATQLARLLDLYGVPDGASEQAIRKILEKINPGLTAEYDTEVVAEVIARRQVSIDDPNEHSLKRMLRSIGAIEAEPPTPDSHDVGEPVEHDDPRAQKYVQTAYYALLSEVEHATEGVRNHTLNAVSYRFGRFVAAGLLNEHDARQQLEACARISGLGEREITRTVKSGLTAGKKSPITLRLRPQADTTVIPPQRSSSASRTDEGGEDAEEEFWQARPVLAHIRQFARARRVAPWAVLGCVLVRVVMALSPRTVLPPLIGRSVSLNLYIGLVGRSGDGKGAAEGAAADAVVLPPIETAGPGSGEGIAHLFAHRNKQEVVRHAESVLFTAPEIDTLTALSERRGATLRGELRKAWFAEPLGFSYADPAKRLPIEAHSYRLGAIVGIQPARAGDLLAGADAGDPQRFVWLPVLDPAMPQTPPTEPPAWKWTGPLKWQALDAVSGQRAIEVCDAARHEIDRNHRARHVGEGEAIDSHSLLCRLKIAAALGFLDGRAEVNADDWWLAGMVAAKSDQTRTEVIDALRHDAAQRNEQRAHAEGVREVIRVEHVEQAAVQRVCRLLRRKLREAHDWMPHAQLRRRLASRDREHFEVAVENLFDAGQVEIETTSEVTRYRSIEETT